jgi:hypothetical protein
VKGQFNSPVTLPDNTGDPVPVSGPLLQVDPGADEATIVCVLVQGDLDDKNENPVWVEGRGTWRRGDGDWTGTVGRKGRVIGGGHRTLGPGRARGIAAAVAVAEEEPAGGKIVPPSIDTLTWCVNIELVEGRDGSTVVQAD